MILGVLSAAGLLALAAVLLPRLLVVDDDEVGKPDVVVALGGRAERATRAAELAEDLGLPLVLSADSIGHGADLGITPGADVHELHPVPETTAGEARGLHELADTMGWSGVLVVTSDFHRRRARLLLRWSLGDRVAVVGPPTTRSRQLPRAALREVAAIGYAYLVERRRVDATVADT